eukprot:GHUV01044091.1.p1 GENE.GHUV01044091.1~~GHUV01044091.1.p1  ORF type:complete len:121 (-),score=44.95 GHUV01044091.1:167-529(-)
MRQESVKAFAEAINKRPGPLNILVNNAGLGYTKKSFTDQGVGMLTQVSSKQWLQLRQPKHLDATPSAIAVDVSGAAICIKSTAAVPGVCFICRFTADLLAVLPGAPSWIPAVPLQLKCLM